MNRIALITTALAMSLVGFQASQAADQPTADPMQSVYGNTITLSILPFWSARQYFDPDHTWRQVDSNGVKVSGVWKVEDGKSCTIQTQPPGPTYCNVFTPRKVGDLWSNYDQALDQTILISLSAGR